MIIKLIKPEKLFVIASMTMAVMSCTEKKESGSINEISNQELRQLFNNPDNQWRGKPFWAWNAALDKEELLRQVDVMKEMGFGGYFMHSRVGLDTEYLGQEWFDLTNSVADYGQKVGMQNFLYDEDRWPSGTAGGYVTKEPEYRLNYMSMYMSSPDEFSWEDNIEAAFICQLDGVNFKNLQRISPQEKIKDKDGYTVLSFIREKAADTDFVNGFSYVDAMNPEATQKYIELTHEAYKKHCGNRIGGSIAGIFTDEPHRGPLFTNFSNDNKNAPYMAPWTDLFASEFKTQFGVDIIEHLPHLFLREEDARFDKIKWQYCELSQQLFLKNFMKPIYDWCSDHNMAFTGHVLHEDNFTAQVAMQGSIMRSYEFMHYPGVDVLTQYNRNYWIVKQLSSVANQLNKEWLLSELYGCSGWQMTFNDYKESGDWQALFGINLRCPHLSWYSMKGEAKRDYPASISYQSGWYKEYHYLEDYYARLGLILSQGKPSREILVINPIETIFAEVSVDAFHHLSAKDEDIKQREARYAELFWWLQGARLDFDYGDEEMMSRLSKVRESEDGKSELVVGSAAYKTVIVSNMATIRSSTLKLLKEFAEKGGKIIVAGDAPYMVDVVESSQASAFFGKQECVAFDQHQIISAVKAHATLIPEVIDAKTGESISDIYCQIRKQNQRSFYTFMNMNTTKAYNDVLIKIPSEGFASEWNCRDGNVYTADYLSKNGVTEIKASFLPIGEHIYALSTDSIENLKPCIQSGKDVIQTFPEIYSYSLNEPNVYPLDFVTYSIDGINNNQLTEVLKADQAIRAHFDVKLRGGTMLQPWFSAKFKPSAAQELGLVKLSYPFQITDIPDEAVTLCIETPEVFTICVNGVTLQNKEDKGWWIDPCFRKITIDKSLLRVGKNEITLTTNFSEDKNLEAMYLVGNFGVALRPGMPVITKLPEKLALGDIVPQGFPFYSGTVSYQMPSINIEHQKVLLNVDEIKGACLKVRCGNESNILAFHPFQIDVTDWLQKKEPLFVDVVLTRRNTFGPLHYIPAIAYAYGPESFVSNGDYFTADYALLPNGLMSPPYITAVLAD